MQSLLKSLRRRALSVLLAAAALAGCAGSHDPVRLSGNVSARERIALAPGSALTVSVLELDTAPAEPRVLAARRFPAGAATPIRFALELDPAALAPERRYALRATISDADGTLRFTSPVPQRLRVPENPRELRVQILVQPVGEAVHAASAATISCRGLTARARFEGEAVQLSLPAGRKAQLAQQPSEVGNQYSDGRITLWGRDADALLVVDGLVYRGCKVRPG